MSEEWQVSIVRNKKTITIHALIDPCICIVESRHLGAICRSAADSLHPLAWCVAWSASKGILPLSRQCHCAEQILELHSHLQPSACAPASPQALPGQQQPENVPCFKLVLVGDGGTGEVTVHTLCSSHMRHTLRSTSCCGGLLQAKLHS